MAWLRSGTVAVVINSTTVTGTNAGFAGAVRSGDEFVGPDGKSYEIGNVASDTVLSLVTPYLGPTISGASYAVKPTASFMRSLVDAFSAINVLWGSKLAALRTTGNYDVLPIGKGGTERTDGRLILAELVANQPPTLYAQQGLFMGWNAENLGEGNFVVNRAAGQGGFTWRSVTQNNGATGPTMRYSHDGILSVPQLSLTSQPLPISSGGTAANTVTGARSNLGLGSAAVLNSGTAAGNLMPLQSGAWYAPANLSLPIATDLYNANNKSLEAVQYQPIGGNSIPGAQSQFGLALCLKGSANEWRHVLQFSTEGRIFLLYITNPSSGGSWKSCELYTTQNTSRDSTGILRAL